jgi:hypothetical protein
MYIRCGPRKQHKVPKLTLYLVIGFDCLEQVGVLDLCFLKMTMILLFSVIHTQSFHGPLKFCTQTKADRTQNMS